MNRNFAASFVFMTVTVPANAAVVTFDSVPVDTVWGMPAGQTAGTSVHSEDGIDVTLQRFFVTSEFSSFNSVRIMPPNVLRPSNHLYFGNVNLRFDFSGLELPITLVSFEFLNIGGIDNLAVNDSPVFIGQMLTLPASIGGASVTIDGGPFPQSYRVTIAGSIDSLTVGGQELFLDSVLAVPSPATTTLFMLAGLAVHRRQRVVHRATT